MREDLAEIICVIDRSGSMDAIRDDAIGGFNTFLNDQKQLPGEARMTLVLFDDQYEVVFAGMPLREVLPLTASTYVPRGMTALLDTVGRTMDSTAIRLSEMPAEQRPGKVIFCILTDGMESASKEYTKEQVFRKVKSHQENGWEFIFLAANQDAIQSGTSMGVAPENNINFDADSQGISTAYLQLSEQVRNRRAR